MTCGIYQVLNTVNQKSYVGQSRNIKKRWKQHTGGLDKLSAVESGSYPLRAAFLKYGLETVVSKAGKVGVFEFRIIEECTEEKLLEREQYWIEEIRPEYNCNTWTPGRRIRLENSGSRFWVQYHNYDKLGYLPAETLLDEGEEEYDRGLSGVSTNKRAILNTQGDTIFLIVGIGKNPKQYYLWSRLVIEEVEIIDDNGEFFYHAFGDGWLVTPPQLLNSSSFDQFKKFCGNFGLGLLSINNSSYLETLKHLSEVHKPQDSKVSFFNYVKDFYTQVTYVNSNFSRMNS